MSDSPFLTVAEVLERWPFLSRDRVVRAMRAGRLKGKREKPGATRFTKAEWVEAWLANWESAADAPEPEEPQMSKADRLTRSERREAAKRVLGIKS